MQLARGRRKRKQKTSNGKSVYHLIRGWTTVPYKNKVVRGRGFRKGVCGRVHTITPKKPNSALRKVARIIFSDHTRIIASIPGEGMHRLAKYSIVLVRGGRVKDLPGVKYKVVRGVHNCLSVEGRVRKRSKYGVKRRPYERVKRKK